MKKISLTRRLSRTTKSLEQIVVRCLKTCEICGKTTKKRCSRCKGVYYCCEEHQRMHWNSEGYASTSRNHQKTCFAIPSQLFKDTPLVYIFMKKYTPPPGTLTALEHVINFHRLNGSHKEHMAVIEWALQQAQLRPGSARESTQLFHGALSNASQPMSHGVKITRLLLRYNVSPPPYDNLHHYQRNTGWRYHPLSVVSRRSNIMNIINKAIEARRLMKTGKARLGWRPWTHQQYTKAYRDTLRTLAVLAKASRAREEL